MTPRPPLLYLLALGILPLIMSLWFPGLAPLGIIYNLLVGGLAAVDLVLTPSKSSILIERKVAGTLSVGARNPVRLLVQNRSRDALEVEITDDYPQPAEVIDLPQTATLGPWKENEFLYLLKPHQRGKAAFSRVHFRFPSRLKMWSMRGDRELVSDVNVYPDIRAVNEYELMAQKNRLSEMGLKMHRLRGQGSEFERLRDYRFEDEIRQVDWKATAKHNRLISREFNVERNQNIVILLDSGRTMRNESDGISHLDRGLNAAIMLSYIALGQGDNVALTAFSAQIERATKAVRGKPGVQTIVRHTFDLEATTDVADYALAVEDMRLRHRKRSLVILITHVVDEQHLNSVGQYFRTLVSPHLVLCVFLKDPAMSQLANRVPTGDIEAFQVAGAAEMQAAHTRQVAKLREAGVLVVETLPEHLTADVINQYLEVKARQMM
jgi:uncharacterized protein (DUF58 family)